MIPDERDRPFRPIVTDFWVYRNHRSRCRNRPHGFFHVDYQRECCKARHDVFTQGRARTEYRVLAVSSKRAAGSLMTDMLRDVMEMDGKTPKRHHYINEHFLINWCLTGKFTALGESTLNAAQLSTMATLRRRDTVLLARGLSYDERKPILHQYVLDLVANDPDQRGISA